MKPKYKQMLAGMSAKENSIKTEEMWFLYILECADGSLYTGITKDIERRFKMHETGKASKYTRTRRPLRLVYQEECSGRTNALVRECNVKSFPKSKKCELIKSVHAMLSNKSPSSLKGKATKSPTT